MGPIAPVTDIQGVMITELKQFSTEGSVVLHMMRRDSPGFTEFGEVYFSEVAPGCVRGWKRHRRMAQNFAVPFGRIRVVLYDDREDSDSRGRIGETVLGRPDQYFRLHIPPMCWYSFGNEASGPALIANCTDMPHDPTESENRPILSPGFPATWRTEQEIED